MHERNKQHETLVRATHNIFDYSGQHSNQKPEPLKTPDLETHPGKVVINLHESEAKTAVLRLVINTKPETAPGQAFFYQVVTLRNGEDWELHYHGQTIGTAVVVYNSFLGKSE
jgi:hypothetical protein